MSSANGIYIDDNAFDFTVTNNTVSNVSNLGIFLHNAHDILLENNLSFNNGTSQMYMGHNTGSDNIVNITMNNNIFFAKEATQKTLGFRTDTSVFNNFGTADNNYYVRPIDDNLTMFTDNYTNGWAEDMHTLAEWQTFSGQDANSHKSPITITDPNNILFDYNATQSNKIVSLGSNTYVDVTGATHTGSVTLLPYTSIILIKTN